MKKRLLSAFVLAATSTSYAHPTSYFDLSLEQLLEIELAGDNVNNLDLLSTPHTNNYFHKTTLEIPKSIEIINADSIKARGLKNVVDVVASMTGILSGESPSEPYSFSTRGFSRDSINVVYDGISVGLASFNTRPLATFNIQQVEFIKGPSELSVGQTAAGGTINIVTKKAAPTHHHIRETAFSYGEYGNRSFNMGLQGPLSNQVYYRADISRVESEGWVEHSDSFSDNLALSLLWQATSSVDVTFAISEQKDELPAYWGTPFVPRDAAQRPNSDVVEHPADLVIDLANRRLNYNIEDHQSWSNSDWLKLGLNWQLTDTVSWQTQFYQYGAKRFWQNAESYAYNPEIAMLERDRLLVSHDRENWGITSDLHFEHTLFGDSNHTSLSVSHQNIDFDRVVGFNLALPGLYTDSVPLTMPMTGDFGQVDQRRDFLTQTNSKITLTNDTQWSNKLQSQLQLSADSIRFDRGYTNWDGSARSRAELDKRFTEVNLVLGASYNIADNSVLYGHYSQSNDPIYSDYRYVYQASNLRRSDVEQLEFGHKRLFNDGKTELTVALFHIDKSVDTQIASGPTIFKSEQRSRGIDFSVNANWDKGISTAFNLAWLDASYKHYYDPELGVQASGNRPANAPEVMANLAASYLFEALPVEIGTRVNFVSSRWANSANEMKLKAYTTTNLFAAYHGEHYHLALHIHNATNEVYAPWSDIYYPNQMLLAAPRQVDLSLSVKF